MTTKNDNGPLSLRQVVGDDVYEVWIEMLGRLVPEGRTHRLSVLVASMLAYAHATADDRGEAGPVARSLCVALESGAPEGVTTAIGDVAKQLFRDAGVPFTRKSAQGKRYSIADQAMIEFVGWHDMPWQGW